MDKQTTTLRKEFSFYDFLKEESFLQEQTRDQWFFRELTSDKYLFEKEEGQPPREYLIDFYTTALDDETIEYYSAQGFEIDYVLNSAKEGVWYYFSRVENENNEPKKHNHKGRVYLLERVKNRIEKFGLVIMVLSLGFFVFQYIQTRTFVFLIAIIFIGAMSLYLYRLYTNLKKTISNLEANILE